jgi:hypothetical protein
MSNPQLSLVETKRFSVPPGGRWFRRLAPVLDANEKQSGFVMAWDAPHRDNKIYGIYQGLSADEMIRCLNAVPPEQRHGYEIMLHHETCPGYMLLKWSGELEPTHKTLKEAVRRLISRCADPLRPAPCIKAFCNSRGTHHSYYITVPNLLFINNHSGQMARFFDLGMDEIDLGVYNKNQTLLLPGNRTRGSDTPLNEVSSINCYI